MATRQQKINRLSNVPLTQAPIPPVPQLPAFLKTRFPDHADEIEAYNLAWVDFLKKSGTIAR